MEFANLVDKEIEQRIQLKKWIMEIILSKYQISKGHVRRGKLQQHVYNELGFQGRAGNNFARLVTAILVENGFRKGYSRGKYVYYGLKETCQDQKITQD